MIVIGNPEEIRALVAPSVGSKPILLRAQESGPCVYYDPGLRDHCTYPYDRACPHLDDKAILCPIKDACSAMRATSLLREACEAEQEEQDLDMAAEAADLVPRSDFVLVPRDPQGSGGDAEVPEFPAIEPEETPVYKTKGRVPEHIQMWTAGENAVLAGAMSRQEAIALFRERFPDTTRTDGAIRRQWYEVRPLATAPPDGRRGSWTPEEDAVLLQETTPASAVTAYQAKFGDAKRTYAALSSRYYRIRHTAPVGDRDPVTQTVEPADESRGGETASHPWFGMRVRVLDPPDLAECTGTVVRYGLGPEELLVALDESPDRVWLPPESLLLIGAGRGSS